MSLQITPNQMSTPAMQGLAALNAPAKGSRRRRRNPRRVRFVRRRNVLQPDDQIDAQNARQAGVFQRRPRGGSVSIAARSEWSEQMSKATAHSFTEPMYKLFSMSRS